MLLTRNPVIKIDYTHPLARGLVGAYILYPTGEMVDLMRGTPPTKRATGNYFFKETGGRRYKCGPTIGTTPTVAGADEFDYSKDAIALRTAGTSMTFIDDVLPRENNGASTTPVFWSTGSISSTTRFAMVGLDVSPNTGPRLRFYYQPTTGTVVDNITTNRLTFNVPSVIGFRMNNVKGTGTWFVDGRQWNAFTFTADATRAATNNRITSFRNSRYSSGNNSLAGHGIRYHLAYAAYLSDAAMRSLTRNPYQILTISEELTYFPPTKYEFVFQAEQFVETGLTSGPSTPMRVFANGTIQVGEMVEQALTPSLRVFSNSAIQVAEFIETQ